MNWLILLFLTSVICNRVKFNEAFDRQVCEGVYSKHDYGGSIKPHISLKLLQYGKDRFDSKKSIKDQPHSEDISLTYIIFEYKDFSSIGYYFEDGQVKYICDEAAVELGICDEAQKGKFIINNNHTNNTILTGKLTHLGQADISYNINQTGYYCVSTFVSDSTKYNGFINFQNAFGNLSASEIPKLPAYGIFTILYMISILLFGWQFFKKRKENQILPLQRYLLAMLGLLTFDTLVVWSYYDLLNRSVNPSSGFNIFYMVFLSILNATKLTFLFFLLLCIALGYGVVTVKLEKKVMLRCKILAGIHFATSLMYLIPTYYSSSQASVNSTSDLSDDLMSELTSLLPLIPITITLCIYYGLILTSIRKTTTQLNQQRQVIKLKLYENLFRLIFFAFFLTFAGVIFASFVLVGMSTTQVIEQSWKFTFFIFQFTPSVIYFVIFMGIAWLWRPTETSYMLAVSQQVAADENSGNTEFELDDMSLISHDDDSFEIGGNPFETPFDQEQQHENLEPHEDTSSGKATTAGDPEGTLFELGDDDDDNVNDGEKLKESTDK